MRPHIASHRHRCLVWCAFHLVAAFAAFAASTHLFAEEPDESNRGDLRRFEYSGVWPFYSREAYEDGSTRSSSLGGAIRFDFGPGADRHHHVLPFYCVALSEDDRDVALYPLLYLHRRSAVNRRYAAVWPLLSVETDREARVGFRHTTSIVKWYDDGERQHFRLAPFLFAGEHRRPETVAPAFDDETRYVPFGGETRVRGPLAWFYYRKGSVDGWFHLLPLGYGAWEADRVRFGVFPLYYRRDWGEEPIQRWTAAR